MTTMPPRSSTTQRTRTVVAGLGKTGLSVARHLLAAGCDDLVLADTRLAPPGLSEIQAGALGTPLPALPMRFGAFARDTFADARRVILSPGLAPELPAIAQARAGGAELLGDIELFARAVDAPVIAITGTNGKSTVTAMVARMAEAAGVELRVGGNYGRPALDLLTGGCAGSPTPPAAYLLELSSFQLETTTSLSPAAAVVLNLAADHLDRYPTMDAYAAAKARIYPRAGRRIVALDDPYVRAMIPHAGTIGFSGSPPVDEHTFGLVEAQGQTWLAEGRRPLLATRSLRVVGRHNWLNALAALAVGRAMGWSMPACLRGLTAFNGLNHRCEWVSERDRIAYYNDSKATNVAAAQAALAGLGEARRGQHSEARVVIIAGGVAKEHDFTPLRASLLAYARGVVLIGDETERLERAWTGAAPLTRAQSMDEAVALATALARPGDAVLLAPACASFDWFKDFVARGHSFRAAVEALS